LDVMLTKVSEFINSNIDHQKLFGVTDEIIFMLSGLNTVSMGALRSVRTKKATTFGDLLKVAGLGFEPRTSGL
jgi:hypothetical protein